jgi:hypothetical protein
MNEEFHKPFIYSLIVVAFFTIVTMFASHYLIESCGQYLYPSVKYSNQTISVSPE